jgi:transcriptional regulator with XRE-family HTH domain
MPSPIITQLVALRKSQGLSGYALAKRLGVPRTTLKRWEEGTVTPSLSNVTAWAAALNHSLILCIH